MSDVTRILSAIERGERKATDELLPLVYEELRQLAARKLSRERPDHTLQATALVHEAYIRLMGAENLNWDSKGHFFGAAAEAMRRILVERARCKQTGKHGGGHRRIGLENVILNDRQECSADHLLTLDESLQALAEMDKIKADLVKLRYFAGLTNHQAANVLGISSATADRHWKFAKAWLRTEIQRRST